MSEYYNQYNNMTHEQYRSTEWWQDFRDKMIKQANNICEACLGYYCDGDLRVHHLHYNTLGRECKDDVMVLCERCHEYTHKHIPMKSWFSAYCPLCSHFICKNASWILMLDFALEPRTVYSEITEQIHSYDNGKMYKPYGAEPEGKKRWAHAKCAKKYRKAKDKLDPIHRRSKVRSWEVGGPRQEAYDQHERILNTERSVHKSQRHYDRWD